MRFFNKKQKLSQKKEKLVIIKNRLYKYLKLKNNNLILGQFPKLKKSQIKIHGNGNILYCDGRVSLQNTNINFLGNNSLVFLKTGKYSNLNISVHNNSVVYIGEKNYFNPHDSESTIILSEEKNLFIGNNNAFSFGQFFRTADPHLIYETNSHKRINPSKSIYIGDHVWIGQQCTILKGTKIHSGSIIGACSVISNKNISSNEVWAGIPAKKVKENIFWTGKCVHAWTEKETLENLVFPEDDYIYTEDNSTIPFEEIENKLTSIPTAYEKYEYLLQLTNTKNRFSK